MHICVCVCLCVCARACTYIRTYKSHMDWPGIKSSSLWCYANK